MSRTASKLTGGFTLIELLMVIVVISILVAIALPNYVRLKEKAKEAEVKANLHNIQLSVERFAVDSEGQYPPYLIGGDNRWVETVRQVKSLDGHQELIRYKYHEVQRDGLSDPLLRLGYMSSYPQNPFVSNGDVVEHLQSAVGDPLRNGSPSRTLGTRFGGSGTLMGQTLCEARWLSWLHVDRGTGTAEEVNTWANIQYEFFDVWLGHKPRPYLPGSFFYKSIGEIIPSGTDIHRISDIDRISQPGKFEAVDEEMMRATLPVSLSDYMLGGWGGLRTKGMDLLGEEPIVVFALANGKRQALPPLMPLDFGGPSRSGVDPGKLPGKASADSGTMIGIPAWTRGVNRSHVGPLWGSPYGAASQGNGQVSYGNANAIRDGLVLWLSGGGMASEARSE